MEVVHTLGCILSVSEIYGTAVKCVINFFTDSVRSFDVKEIPDSHSYEYLIIFK